MPALGLKLARLFFFTTNVTILNTDYYTMMPRTDISLESLSIFPPKEEYVIW